MVYYAGLEYVYWQKAEDVIDTVIIKVLAEDKELGNGKH